MCYRTRAHSVSLNHGLPPRFRLLSGNHLAEGTANGRSRVLSMTHRSALKNYRTLVRPLFMSTVSMKP